MLAEHFSGRQSIARGCTIPDAVCVLRPADVIIVREMRPFLLLVLFLAPRRFRRAPGSLRTAGGRARAIPAYYYLLARHLESVGPGRGGHQGPPARDRARPGLGRAARRAGGSLRASGQRRRRRRERRGRPRARRRPIRKRTGFSARSTRNSASGACPCGRATIRPPIRPARLPRSRRRAARASTSASTSCSAGCICRPGRSTRRCRS